MEIQNVKKRHQHAQKCPHKHSMVFVAGQGEATTSTEYARDFQKYRRWFVLVLFFPSISLFHSLRIVCSIRISAGKRMGERMFTKNTMIALCDAKCVVSKIAIASTFYNIRPKYMNIISKYGSLRMDVGNQKEKVLTEWFK